MTFDSTTFQYLTLEWEEDSWKLRDGSDSLLASFTQKSKKDDYNKEFSLLLTEFVGYGCVAIYKNCSGDKPNLLENQTD